MKLSYKKILSFEPCYDPVRHITKDWTGTAIDLLRMKHIPAKDRLWVCLRKGILTKRQYVQFALACARSVEKHATDTRVKQCNDIVEQYLKGRATRMDVETGQWGAAYAAFWTELTELGESAAWTAVWAAKVARWEWVASMAWITEVAGTEKQCQFLINILTRRS